MPSRTHLKIEIVVCALLCIFAIGIAVNSNSQGLSTKVTSGQTNVPATVTQPMIVQAVTFSTLSGRCNIHLLERPQDLAIVYVANSELAEIHQIICQMSMFAYSNRLAVSVQYSGGESVTTGNYWKYDFNRLTFEDEATGLVPWNNRE